MSQKKECVLSLAQTLVHGERGEDYGHPLDDFSRTAKMWSAILGFEIRPEQVGLCMMAVKISRQCNSPKRDNMVDAAGYAATVQMVLDEQEARKEQWHRFREEIARAESLGLGSDVPPTDVTMSTTEGVPV